MSVRSDERIEAIERARMLAKGFVEGGIAFSPFYGELSRILGDSFDGIDSVVGDLPEHVQQEIRFYSHWTGGEFGESRDTLPLRRDWTYGADTEPYGWIDAEVYQSRFSAAFERITLIDLSALAGT